MAERRTPQQQLAAVEAKAARLRHQISEDRRKAETREKIVIGGTVLAAMADDAELRGRVVALLQENVTRPLDKEAVAAWLSSTSP